MTDEPKFEEHYKTWHRHISYAKSAIRIAGCAFCLGFLGVGSTVLGIAFLAVFFAFAEFLGIIEEWI